MRKMSDKVEKIKTRKIKKVFGPLMEKREVSLIFLLIIMVLALMTQTNKFATAANLRVLLNGVSTDMMIAIPMAINLIASNTDFSVGSSLCFSSMIAGLAMANGASPAIGILVGLGMGALLGFVNGLAVNKLRVSPLVATLGTWYTYAGLAQVIAGTQSITRFEESFLKLGRFEIGWITAPIIYMILIIIVGYFALKYVNFFHNAYYIGSNKNHVIT
jgi:ribose/xylose/arabinose/galactoside ABC-type transport system permease subunit